MADSIGCKDTASLNMTPNYIYNNIMNVDDSYSNIIDLGFDFDFYGTTYNKMLISTNGYITFDTSNAYSFSPWLIAKVAAS